MLIKDDIVNKWYTDKDNFVAIYFKFFWMKILRKKMTLGFSVCPMFWMAVMGFLLEKPYLIAKKFFQIIGVNPKASGAAFTKGVEIISSLEGKIPPGTGAKFLMGLLFCLITIMWGALAGTIASGFIISIPIVIGCYLFYRLAVTEDGSRYFWEWDIMAIVGAVSILSLFNIGTVFASIVAVIVAIATSIGWVVSLILSSIVFMFKFAAGSLPLIGISLGVVVAFMAVFHFLDKAGILGKADGLKSNKVDNIDKILASFVKQERNYLNTGRSVWSEKDIQSLRFKQTQKELCSIVIEEFYNKYSEYLKDIKTCEHNHEMNMGRLSATAHIYNEYLSDHKVSNDEYKTTVTEINDTLYDSLLKGDAKLRKADARTKRNKDIWDSFWASMWTNAKAKKEQACPYKTFDFDKTEKDLTSNSD